uniref:Pyruvate dehydrogenase E1 component n=1 Tax=uncultured organism TaxID=155900 RepID=G8DB21_9ZZZZ|nr:pyruvate dehydrogenase E1 component [uncultured organism]
MNSISSIYLKNNKILTEKIIKKCMLIRLVEERLLQAFSEGELYGTIHTCIGQELIGVMACQFINQTDTIFSNHRCHGHFLSFTNDVEGLISEIYGKKTGVCSGIGGSQHLYKNNFYSNGIQGGFMPVAAGLAYSFKENNKIAIIFIGDGTLGEGILYETYNIIALLKLPLLIILENNLYAQSTHQKETLSGDILKRAQAFNIYADKSDIWNWNSLYKKMEFMINYVRHYRSPAFLEVSCYRLKAHSKGDDDRDENEINFYKKKDPVKIIMDQIFHKLQKKSIISLIKERIENAIYKAKKDVYANYKIYQYKNYNIFNNYQNLYVHCKKNKRISTLLNNTLHNLMKENSNIILLGEDIKDPYGGAFKITKGLSSKFPDRVINTPISEAAIVGFSCGMSLSGLLPIVEIMFGDFITLAFDQILNHASKLKYMYNYNVSTPIIIRTPMGGGRGYGPTHSQTLEKHFLGIPGIRIFAINNLFNPEILYKSILKNNQELSIIIENKILYTKNLLSFPLKGYFYKFKDYPQPTIMMLPKSNLIDITLITYGGLVDIIVEIIEELFEEHDLIAQLICPIQIYPCQLSEFSNLIKKSSLIVLIEEGQGFANFSSEMLSQLIENDKFKNCNFLRCSSEPSPIPASIYLEDKMLPNKTNILRNILEIYNEKKNVNSKI